MKDQSGFTIVELVATIIVVGIVSIGLSTLFYNLQYTQRQTNYLDTATRAAQREIEVLRNNSYNSLTPGQNINFTSDLPTSGLPRNATGTVVVSEPQTGLRRVDVTVSYTDAGRSQQVNLSSVIGEIGLSQ